MRSRADILRFAFAAFVLTAATCGQATIYRWVDESGNVTYSNAPPTEPHKAHELVTIEEERPPTSIERRTREILEQAERERRGVDSATLPPPAQGLWGDNVGRDSQMGAIDGMRPEITGPEGEARRDAYSGSRSPRGAPSEAVRDPCLTSSDRNCYQRNARKYHPYLGYSPSRVEPFGTGGTISGAGGTVGGTIVQVPVTSGRPSARRPSGLPPGTPVLPLSKR
ncbi:MAG: DUF4124 domain-containing protein [Burkholderiales bacterium]